MIAIDGGPEKGEFVKSLGATHYIDFKTTTDTVSAVWEVAPGGVHAVIVTAGSGKAFSQAASMLKIGGTLCCVGIPPGNAILEVPIALIVIKGLRITGNLVGSLKECMEAVELDTRGVVKPTVVVRPFEDLPAIYEQMEKGDIMGRVVLKVARDE